MSWFGELNVDGWSLNTHRQKNISLYLCLMETVEGYVGWWPVSTREAAMGSGQQPGVHRECHHHPTTMIVTARKKIQIPLWLKYKSSLVHRNSWTSIIQIQYPIFLLIETLFNHNSLSMLWLVYFKSSFKWASEPITDQGACHLLIIH